MPDPARLHRETVRATLNAGVARGWRVCRRPGFRRSSSTIRTCSSAKLYCSVRSIWTNLLSSRRKPGPTSDVDTGLRRHEQERGQREEKRDADRRFTDSHLAEFQDVGASP